MGGNWTRFSLQLFQMFNLWKGSSRVIMSDGRKVKGYTEKLETTIREFWKEHNNALFVRFG